MTTPASQTLATSATGRGTSAARRGAVKRGKIQVMWVCCHYEPVAGKAKIPSDRAALRVMGRSNFAPAGGANLRRVAASAVRCRGDERLCSARAEDLAHQPPAERQCASEVDEQEAPLQRFRHSASGQVRHQGGRRRRPCASQPEYRRDNRRRGQRRGRARRSKFVGRGLEPC